MWKSALGMLFVTATVTSAHAQSVDTVHRAPKSATTAVLWSAVIPGAGQMYAGEPVAGLFLLGATLYSFGQMSAKSESQCAVDVHCDPRANHWRPGWAYAGGAIWALSIGAAPYSVSAYNKRHGLAPLVAPGANGTTQLGLALRF